MKFGFMKNDSSEFRVQKMADTLGVTRSAYYAWKKRGESQRSKENGRLLSRIRVLHAGSHGIYGSRRIRAALRNDGQLCGKNRIARLMRQASIVSRMRRKFKVTTHSKHSFAKADNLVRQNFSTDKPNRLWVSDITYIWTKEGWLYLAVIIDVFSRLVVGWSLSDRLHHSLVLQAFRQAERKRDIRPGLIFHSDQGVQYACEDVKEQLLIHQIVQSMSGSGNCYDNALAESFFHSIKTEWIYFEKYETKGQASLSIFEYIESFYNRQRIHSNLGYQSPEKYEKLKA
jgi:transposase InsO family protein